MAGSIKRRLDTLLVERGLAGKSHSRRRRLVLAGAVWSRDRRLEKPGTPTAEDEPLELRGRDHPWQSRGGQKLAHALGHFAIDPAGLVALDIGASTGGFAHVLLTRGARRVYAVDVGHGQLAWSLRNDERVVVRERVNARYLTAEHVPEPPQIITCDASFIGLETILPAPLALAAPDARLVALIKPQFEVGAARVGKGGVVRNPALHREVCERVCAWLAARPGWQVEGVTESPIQGPQGNIEFLVSARRGA